MKHKAQSTKHKAQSTKHKAQSTKHKALFVLFVTFISLSACRQEEKSSPEPQVQPTQDRLNFKNPDELKLAIQTINRSKDKKSTLSQIAAKYSPSGRFQSLNDYKSSLTSNLNQSAARQEALAIKADSLDELVPDPAFASLLNDKLEITVNGMVYKVTPRGTFYCPEEKLDKLYAILEDTQANAPQKRLMPEEHQIGDYLYQLPGDDDIYRYDTYVEATENNPTSARVTGTGCNSVEQPFACGNPLLNVPTTTFVGKPLRWCLLPEDAYCSLVTHTYGANTVVGKWIEGVVGRNEDFSEDFDGRNRVRVNLYNLNFVVFSTIGIKVKFQRQGWTGIWYKTNTEQLAIGWDALVFEVPFAYSAPTGLQPFPGKTFAKEVIKFPNFDVQVDAISYLDNRLMKSIFPDKDYDLYSNKTISDALNDLANQQLGDLSKKIWNYAKQEYAPHQVAAEQASTKAFRYFFPDKYVMALSRWETAYNNDSEINLTLDFNTIQIGYSGNGQEFEAWKNFIQPSLEKGAKSYTIKKASIFGAAKYNNTWKGVRIVKE